MNRRLVRRTLLILVVVLALAQLVPVDRSNPPAGAEVAAPPEVRAILKRACYDCHSSETVWPWYSRVAPVSWLIARDVRQGRSEANFSIFTQYPDKRRQRKWKEITEQIEKREMPPWSYTAVHPEARLSDADRETLLRWAAEGARLEGSAPAPPSR
jgi:cytochrome c551/c552